MSQPSNKLIGFSSVFASAICFYLATTTLRWARINDVTVDSVNFVFGRFLLGFLMVGTLLLVKKSPPKPVNWHYLIGRTVANTMAVYCFFKAVDLTSVAEGNILNMTYPLFVALFSWFTLKDERNPASIFVVLIALNFHDSARHMVAEIPGWAAKLVFLNILLACFNLLPVPPLDGGQILVHSIERTHRDWAEWLQRYGIFVFIVMLPLLPFLLSPVMVGSEAWIMWLKSLASG